MQNQIEQFSEETFPEMIRRIYGGSGRDFTEETILGSDINRIRHLFYYLKSEEVRIEIFYRTERYRARVEQVEGSNALLRAPGFEEGALRRCRLKFGAFNELYQFEVSILTIGKDTITIKIPTIVQSVVRRKYKRVQSDELFMKFNIIHQSVFDEDESNQYVETRYPAIIKELQSDEPNLILINRIITSEILNMSPYYELVFYHVNKPDTFMDRMIEQYGKTIYIRDTVNLKHFIEPLQMYGLENYRQEYLRLAAEDSHDAAEKFLEGIRKEQNRDYIYNYVCTPLRIFDRIVGRLYVHTSTLEKPYISAEQAHILELLIGVLGYAMSKTVMARTYFRDPLTRVGNLSITGLLFEIEDEHVFNYLTGHDRIRMILKIKNRELHLEGEIQRFYAVDDSFHVGVHFTSGGPDDFKILEEFIHQRSRITFY